MSSPELRRKAMLRSTALRHAAPDPLASRTDMVLAGLARDGHEGAVRVLVQRYNQRLYRLARAVLRNDAEAEDAVQSAYMKAFASLHQFRGAARFSTWLTRIALNEALAIRRRKHPGEINMDEMPEASLPGQVVQFPGAPSPSDPESDLARTEARRLLEHAFDTLPEGFRTVFVLREVEGLSIRETAAQLGLLPETVKTRLHRARKMLRRNIEKQLSGSFAALFPFNGPRCARMADRIVAQLRTRQG